MMSSRPRRLLFVSATYHGAQAVRVARNISSRAREQSYQREYDFRSPEPPLAPSCFFAVLRMLSPLRLGAVGYVSAGLTSPPS
jgi:hypothetical protein